MEYFEVIIDAQTGEQTVRPYTPQEIAAARKSEVPRSLSPRQTRLLLLQRGMLASVEQMIAAQDEATRIAWEYAIEFQRNDPLLIQLATAHGLSDADIDQFFAEATAL